jgi:hypothetical protein
MEVDTLKNELEKRLQTLNIRCNREIKINTNPPENNQYNIDNINDFVTNNLIVKMIIAGAFYPNYFNALPIDLDQAHRLIGGRLELNKTVQLKNLPNNEGILYDKQILQHYATCGSAMKISYENTRAYIEFKTDRTNDYNINLSVLIACQMRLLRMPAILKKYKSDIANDKMRNYNKLKEENRSLNLTQSFESGSIKVKGSNLSSNSHHNFSDRSSTASDWDQVGSVRSKKNCYQSLSSTSSGNLANRTLSDSDDETLCDSDEEQFRRSKAEQPELIDTSKKFSMMSLAQNANNNNANIGKPMAASSRTNSVRSYDRDDSLNASILTNSSSRHESNRDYEPKQLRHLTSNVVTSSNGLIDILSDPFYVLPKEVDDGYVRVVVTEVKECGAFWCHIDDQLHIDTLKEIQNCLNYKQTRHDVSSRSLNMSRDSIFSANQSVIPYKLISLHSLEIKEDTLCVCRYSGDDTKDQLYRARVLRVSQARKKVKVIFVDYGNEENKRFDEIFQMSDELKGYPFQAVDCQIANIKPSLLKNPNGGWEEKSTKEFKEILKTQNKHLEIKVESFDSTRSKVLINLSQIDDHYTKDVGRMLVDSGYADYLADSEKILKATLSNNYGSSEQKIYYIPYKQSSYTAKRPEYASHNSLHHISAGNKLPHIYKQNDDDNVSLANTSIISSSRYSSLDTSQMDQSDENENLFNGTLELHGPYSPLESSFFSLINGGRTKRVAVERESVNFVTLDQDPLNQSTRLMVATTISLNQSGSSIVARKTTLMPKLPGLSTICCLLFTPFMEIRVDSKETCYTGALCGLGFDELNRMPIYTDNDIECVFDSQIDVKDMSLINAVRMAINMVIGNEKEVENWTNNDRNLRLLQQTTCQKLLSLMQRQRDLIKEPIHFPRQKIWNQVDPKKLIKTTHRTLPNSNSSSTRSDSKEEKLLYSYHSVVALKSVIS